MKCNHLACKCEIGAGQTYCGDYCEKEPQTGMETSPQTCRCGHDPCGSVNDPATHT